MWPLLASLSGTDSTHWKMMGQSKSRVNSGIVSILAVNTLPTTLRKAFPAGENEGPLKGSDSSKNI